MTRIGWDDRGARYSAWDRIQDERRAERLALRPYGVMCRNPKACEGKGYCPLDPTCGD